jgi:hypothetical protein
MRTARALRKTHPAMYAETGAIIGLLIWAIAPKTERLSFTGLCLCRSFRNGPGNPWIRQELVFPHQEKLSSGTRGGKTSHPSQAIRLLTSLVHLQGVRSFPGGCVKALRCRLRV